MSFSSVPFWLYFGFLLGALLVGSRSVSHPWLFLLRSFFPNWQFYHGLGHTPRIYWRPAPIGGLENDKPDWQPLLSPHQRRLIHLVHNPVVNLAHAQQTLIDQLANDLADRSDTEKLHEWVSYRMVERLVREKILEQMPTPSAIQFCLCLPHMTKPIDFTTDIALQSSILSLNHE